MKQEAKTKPTTQDVNSFVETLPSRQKKQDALQLLQLFQEATGAEAVMWGPSIIGFGSYHYRYASGREGDAAKVGFSPRKTAISLYLMLEEEDRQKFLQRLGKHREGKGCLYVNKLADIDPAVLKEMIRAAWQHVERLYPAGGNAGSEE